MISRSRMPFSTYSTLVPWSTVVESPVVVAWRLTARALESDPPPPKSACWRAGSSVVEGPSRLGLGHRAPPSKNANPTCACEHEVRRKTRRRVKGTKGRYYLAYVGAGRRAYPSEEEAYKASLPNAPPCSWHPLTTATLAAVARAQAACPPGGGPRRPLLSTPVALNKREGETNNTEGAPRKSQSAGLGEAGACPASQKSCAHYTE